MAGFQDFIPDGQDTGAVGDGFKDFVKPKEPVKQPLAETPASPVEQPKPAEPSKSK